MFLLKGGYAVFVLTTGTMTVSEMWNLVSPNPVGPGSTQSGSLQTIWALPGWCAWTRHTERIFWHLA